MDWCLRKSAGDGDSEHRSDWWLQALQRRWGKWARFETMENVVSVKDDYHVNTHEGGQRAFYVLDAGWRRSDGSGAP